MNTQALEALGIQIEDLADEEPVEIWPENLETVELFLALATQWA